MSPANGKLNVMRPPDWRIFDLPADVLREPVGDDTRLVLWIPAESADGDRHWDRVGTVAGADVTADGGICAVPAFAIRVRQRVRGVFGRLVHRLRGSPEGKAWVLPTG